MRVPCIVACVQVTTEGSEVIETSDTITDGLSDWLVRHRVTHVAMESTGVLWKPVWKAAQSTLGKTAATRLGKLARW